MSELDATAHEGVDATETETDALAPEATAEEPEEVSDTDEAEPEGDEGEQDEQAVEEVEYDLGGGQKLKVPANATAAEVFEAAQKAFKDVEANYTRKQQAVAEQAKAIQARAEAVQKLETLNGEALSEYSKGLQIRQEIEQLSAVDLRSLWQSNPDQARQVSDMLAMKQAEFQRVVAKVAQIEQGMTQAQHAEMARLASEGEAKVSRSVKGFNAAEVVSYAVQNGISESDAKAWALNPEVAIMAHKAMMYDRMQTKAAKPVAKPAPAAPVKPVKGSAGAGDAPDPSKMTPAQMAKYLGLGRR